MTSTLHDFEPFGVEIVPLSASSNTHRYTGQERDVLDVASNATVDNMHFRFMGVGLGRFMRPDNVNGSPGNPQSWNLYAYVRGNPVGFNDPTGHLPNPGSVGTEESHSPGAAPDMGLTTWWLHEAESSESLVHQVEIQMQTTITYYRNGNPEKSVTINWSETMLVSKSGGIVEGSWMANGAQVGRVEGDKRLTESQMKTMSRSAEAILGVSESRPMAILYLAIGMKETLLGIARPAGACADPINNPTSVDSTVHPVTSDINQNVRTGYSILKGSLSNWASGRTLDALHGYNPSPQYNLDVLRSATEAYEAFKMTH
jgi:RHS repeat-associated protein